MYKVDLRFIYLISDDFMAFLLVRKQLVQCLHICPYMIFKLSVRSHDQTFTVTRSRAKYRYDVFDKHYIHIFLLEKYES